MAADRPAAINPGMPPVGFVAQQQRVRQMINSGTLLISAAWSVIIMHCASSGSSSGPDEAEAPFPPAAGGWACALVAFLLFLVGVSLLLLALVADRFPRAAVVGVAVARELRRYLLGLG